MNVLFDTSVIVPALVDQLSNHPKSFEAFINFTSNGNKGFCSTHCLAECYAVFTALPLPRRITQEEALRLIDQSILGRLEVISLDLTDYQKSLTSVAVRGLSGGIIYDALHITAAVKATCMRIFTYNLNHFQPLCPENILLTAP